MNVYILSVDRRSDFNNDSYIDSVFDSEEKVWNRIEEKFYDLATRITTSKDLFGSSEVKYVKISSNQLYFQVWTTYKSSKKHIMSFTYRFTTLQVR